MSREAQVCTISQKILSLAEVDDWIAAQRRQHLRVGFTCGSFDLLHPGHAQYLARARERCDRLLVAVNTDASVRRYKNPLRPINPENHRMYLVAAMAAVDAVTPMEEDRPLSLLERWKPDLYLKGGDYGTGSLRSADAVRAYGGEVEVIGSDFNTSSSKLIERIVAQAAHAAPASAPMAESPRGLVLLDRDGTLIRDVPFLRDPKLVELLPGVGEGLRLLQDAGLRLAMVTNQQGIALGYLTAQDFISVNQQLFRALGPYGVLISKIYYCPHSAADGCSCRKPESGMVWRALREFGVSSERAFLIGDTRSDVEAGLGAGVQTVSVGLEGVAFEDAAKWILRQL